MWRLARRADHGPRGRPRARGPARERRGQVRVTVLRGSRNATSAGRPGPGGIFRPNRGCGFARFIALLHVTLTSSFQKARETSYRACYDALSSSSSSLDLTCTCACNNMARWHELHATWTWRLLVFIHAGKPVDSTALHRGCQSTRHCAPSHDDRIRSGTFRSARPSTWQ